MKQPLLVTYSRMLVLAQRRHAENPGARPAMAAPTAQMPAHLVTDPDWWWQHAGTTVRPDGQSEEARRDNWCEALA